MRSLVNDRFPNGDEFGEEEKARLIESLTNSTPTANGRVENVYNQSTSRVWDPDKYSHSFTEVRSKNVGEFFLDLNGPFFLPLVDNKVVELIEYGLEFNSSPYYQPDNPEISTTNLRFDHIPSKDEMYEALTKLSVKCCKYWVERVGLDEKAIEEVALSQLKKLEVNIPKTEVVGEGYGCVNFETGDPSIRESGTLLNWYSDYLNWLGIGIAEHRYAKSSGNPINVTERIQVIKLEEAEMMGIPVIPLKSPIAVYVPERKILPIDEVEQELRPDEDSEFEKLTAEITEKGEVLIHDAPALIVTNKLHLGQYVSGTTVREKAEDKIDFTIDPRYYKFRLGTLQEWKPLSEQELKTLFERGYVKISRIRETRGRDVGRLYYYIDK